MVWGHCVYLHSRRPHHLTHSQFNVLFSNSSLCPTVPGPSAPGIFYFARRMNTWKEMCMDFSLKISKWSWNPVMSLMGESYPGNQLLVHTFLRSGPCTVFGVRLALRAPWPSILALTWSPNSLRKIAPLQQLNQPGTPPFWVKERALPCCAQSWQDQVSVCRPCYIACLAWLVNSLWCQPS